jgi:acetyl-CoA acetyltransferase
MGLKGEAAVVGVAQYKPEKYGSAPRMFHLEQVAELAGMALADAGMTLAEVDGLAIVGPQFHEAGMFVPAMVGEYLGARLNFAEVVDLGGASSVGMIWRAAAAIELGLCETVLCVIPARLAPLGAHDDHAAEVMKASRYGGHSTRFGAPEAEMDLPYGHMAQNTGYAMIAQRYAAVHGYDAVALAQIAVAQRFNACHNPEAIFYGQPISVDDVLNSRVVAEPLRMLEIVMPVAGGAAVIVTRSDRARDCKHRAVQVIGCGEHVQSKSPTYAADMLATPIGPASRKAFAMASLTPADIHHHRDADARRRRLLRKRPGDALRARTRPDLQGRLSDEYAWWPTELRPDRVGWWHDAGDRGGSSDSGAGPRAPTGAARSGLCLRHRRRDE